MVPLGALAQVFGTVDAVGGAVSIIHEDGIQSPPVTTGIREVTSTGVVTEDGGLLAMRPNTRFKVLQFQATQDHKAMIDMSLVRGALRSITGWIGKINPSGY